MEAQNNVTDYATIPEQLLPETLGDDGAAWAAAFCQFAKKNGLDIDEGWMIGWFANAIEASHDCRMRRAQPLPEPPK